ncbi:hypothetical protein WS88_20655 [Burkholderia cepacia]|nr:hypothetical protein WS88_20655 [Burkholderia cepacia]
MLQRERNFQEITCEDLRLFRLLRVALEVFQRRTRVILRSTHENQNRSVGVGAGARGVELGFPDT